MITLGRFTAEPLSDGTFRLDGGAMYGTVPKNLWERHEHADEKNRIPLSLGVLLLRTPSGHNILVDTGLSSKYDSNVKFNRIYSVERTPLRDQLQARGLSPSDIHLVINTHLHFDHAGGDTEWLEGRLRPAFPNARYLIQKDEWQDAQHPHERSQASYMEENFAPLEEHKVLELVRGEYEIEPGLKVIRSGGHTRGHQCVVIESEGQTGIFLGDLIPTRSHVPLPYIMAYDLYPMDTLECKRKFYAEAVEKDWTLIFQHDVGRRHAKLGVQDGRYYAKIDA